MALTHLQALTESLAMYALLATACWGWGAIALRCAGREQDRERLDLLLPWIGWATLLLLLQVVHCMVPLDWRSVAPLLGAGVFAALWQGRRTLRPVHSQRSSALRIVACLMLLLLAMHLAARAMLAPTIFDAGLYYLGAMRWIREYALVPGIGNLHTRLAYNQSALIWAAALDLHPWMQHGRSIANAFLLLLATVTLGRWAIASGPTSSAASLRHGRTCAVLALPVLVMPWLSLQSVTAPTPDTVVQLLQMMIGLGLIAELERWSRGEPASETWLAALGALAATAVTVKLSAAAFSACVILLCLLRGWNGVGRKRALRALAPAGLVLTVWMLRGYLQSGVPLFPATVGRIEFDWAVPPARLLEETRWIYSWARSPGAHWSSVLGNDAWLGPWSERALANGMLIRPLAVASVLLPLAALLAFVGRTDRRGMVLWLATLPGLAAIVFWFLTAPDPRFVLGAFWYLGVAAATVFLHHVRPLIRPILFRLVMLMTFLILNKEFLEQLVEGRSLLAMASDRGWHALPQAELNLQTSRSGLAVWVAEADGRCWGMPLPCAPALDPQLEARSPGDLAGGFRIAAPGAAP